MTAQRLRMRTPAGPLDTVLDGGSPAGTAAFTAVIAALWTQLLPETHEQREDGGAAPELPITVAATDANGQPMPLSDLVSLAYSASGAITRWVLSRLVGTRLLLHSGAVEHPEHGTVLLIGPSGAGKSTAAAALARTGHYLSDELAVLDPHDLSLDPYPKPLSRVGDDGGKHDCSLVSEGLRAGGRTGPPRHVLLLHRVRARGTDVPCCRLRRLPLVEALPQIIAQSSSIWALQDPLGALARMLTGSGGALVAEYREAEQITGALTSLPPAVREPWVTVPGPGRTAAPEAHTDSQRISIVPFTQALLVRGDAVVLLQERVATLRGVTALIWDILRTEGPLPREALRRELIDAAGHHPEADAIMETALSELRRTALLA